MKRLFVEALLFVVAVLPTGVGIRCLILASTAFAWSIYKCVETYKSHIIAQERARAVTTERNVIRFKQR